MHPHRGQSYPEAPAKTGARPIAPDALLTSTWNRLQILTVASLQQGQSTFSLKRNCYPKNETRRLLRIAAPVYPSQSYLTITTSQMRFLFRLPSRLRIHYG